METINSWKDIEWRTVQQSVFRLQLRIYKAAANQEYGKMYKLQKLLISSQYAKYLAVRKVTQDNTGKRTPGVDKRILTTPNDKFALATELTLNGKSSPIRRTYVPKPDGRLRPLGIPTIEDCAKQELAYLVLCPQWEAHFEATSYGFRPGRSTTDAIENVWVGIAKTPKWVLDANISKCLDRINHQYLLDKCNTFPEMRKQIRAWLKVGILDSKEYAFPEMGGVILPLLSNIALHGLREELDTYINSLGGHRSNNRQSLTYVRYADDFVLMHPDRYTTENLKKVTQKFLESIGLTLHPTKTRLVHTLQWTNESYPGFTFLGYDVVQKLKRKRQPAVSRKKESNQTFFTLITPSKKGIKKQKRKLRDTIRRYRGTKQSRLIQELNTIIRGWAQSKRTVISSKIFQDLDQYLFLHLWKWAKKRHPKMSRYKLKDIYWHKVGGNHWVFGVKKDNEISMLLQTHSRLSIQLYAKGKDLMET
jgi:RNA-directed DNA polymerase